MQIVIATVLSALMVVTSMVYNKEHQAPALGASQTISSLTAGTSLDDADTMAYVDNSGAPTTKKITWGNATSTLQSWFGTLYSPIFSTSAGLAGLLSDETGSAGGFVRATGASIGTPTIDAPTINTSFAGTAILPISMGGTGSSTKLDALNALLPRQNGNSGKYLQTDGSNGSWSAYAFPVGNGLASSTSLMNDGAGNLIWHSPNYVLGSTTDVYASSTVDGTVNGAAAKKKEIALTISGCGWIGWEAKCDNVDFCHFQYYKNGVAVGPLQAVSNVGSYAGFTVGFCGDRGDLIQLYGDASGGGNGNYRRVKYYGGIISTTTSATLTTDI